MGGVWCKAEKGQPRSFSPKVPFNSAITKWTNHVRQAYRKPKPPRHRPPRPPQKPLRSNNRLTISHPQLVAENSTDGWRTATLLVPEAAPVPPPRKKRKHNQDLTRTAYSMDDLNRPEPLNISTISLSLADRYKSEPSLDLKNSSSTVVVTPVLEARQEHLDILPKNDGEGNKENMKTILKDKIEEVEEEFVPEDLPEEIIPIEKDTLFSSRTLLHSNLGYVDKLSAISEVSTVSTESGFEDRIDLCKFSGLSGSISSSESGPREQGLNILAHIQNINSVSQLSEDKNDKGVKEKTALTKQEWLQNILKIESEPFFLSNSTNEDSKMRPNILQKDTKEISEGKNLNTVDKIEVIDRKRDIPEVNNSETKTPPSSPVLSNKSSFTSESANNHSVLLELLKANKISDDEPLFVHPFSPKEESIFLTDTKTNIIYKTLSSDNLSEIFDDCSFADKENTDSEDALQLKESPTKSEDEVSSSALPEGNSTSNSSTTNLVSSSTSNSHLTDYFFHPPRLVRSNNSLVATIEDNANSCDNFREILKSQSHESALKNSKTTDVDLLDKNLNVVVNGSLESEISTKTDKVSSAGDNNGEKTTGTKEQLTKKESISSSRRSSITDSLHEFELSIYDMLKESKKNRDSSDEEESLKSIKPEAKP